MQYSNAKKRLKLLCNSMHYFFLLLNDNGCNTYATLSFWQRVTCFMGIFYNPELCIVPRSLNGYKAVLIVHTFLSANVALHTHFNKLSFLTLTWNFRNAKFFSVRSNLPYFFSRFRLLFKIKINFSPTLTINFKRSIETD